MKICDYHLGFVGFGHMAQIICQAIEQAKLIPRSQMGFIRRDPHKAKQSEQKFGITATSLENLVDKSQILLLCVRPNQADLVLKELSEMQIDDSKLIITVLAGVKLAHYQKYLGKSAQLIRVMPNIASAVTEGMSVFSYGPGVQSEFQSAAHLLFSCMGQVIEVPEKLMDISCAVAGSGPGFVFRLIESMARAGEKQGLEYSVALKMAAQTFLGAAKLILKGHQPETLLQQIATPNGTTEAGLKKINECHIDEHFQTVVEASMRRSKELSEEFSH